MPHMKKTKIHIDHDKVRTLVLVLVIMLTLPPTWSTVQIIR